VETQSLAREKVKIFIEVPTWLGDAVMITPALENIVATYPDAKITLFGSFVSTQALGVHPNVVKTVQDRSKERGFRLLNLFKIAKELGQFEMAFSFRKTLFSKLLNYMIDAKKHLLYRRLQKESMHQVRFYNLFVQNSLGISAKAGDLQLYHERKVYTKPTLGINPGAAYGSAKRWDALRFAKVAASLSGRYDIVIFAGPAEVEMARDIEKALLSMGVHNYQNLGGKTTIPQLLSHIGGLDLFITNDSGPMHVAAAYKIPTVAIFGPTKHQETSPWKNPKSEIVRVNLTCAPCMKRVCPLGTDACMDKVSVEMVLEAVQKREQC
jgi:heptosyltransferase-2